MIHEKYPNDDIIIMVGHLNTKVGSNNTLFGRIMGKHDPREDTDKCERFTAAGPSTASSLVVHSSNRKAAVRSAGFQLTHNGHLIRSIHSDQPGI